MTPLAQKVYEANQERYRTAKNPLRSHGPDHHLRVYKHALHLAEKLQVIYDEDILAGAALLHDMAAYYPEESGANYHDFDDKMAAKVLKSIDFPADKLKATLFAIANHGSDAKYKSDKEPIEVTLLRDADKLDVFGPIGVARIIMVRTLKGDTMKDIVEDFYTKGHLERKWNSITSEQARSMAQADYEYSNNFFKQLATSLQD
jgi:HD superfamily phosphodiesterase